MENVVELNKPKKSSIKNNPDVKTLKNGSFASDKLQKAEETFAKYGFPEEWANEEAAKGEKLNFWTAGKLIQADAKENTFSLCVVSKDEEIPTENIYIISTSTEILSTIVKGHWGNAVNVFLRPKAIIGQPFYYDLLEIK